MDGPNFDQRKVDRDQVLYAIANGGFSSGPMPQDILVGEDAEKVADFLAANSGSEVPPSRSRPSRRRNRAPRPEPRRGGRCSSLRPVLDLKAIREDPAPVREALARRRDGSAERLERVLALDVRRRELLPEVEGIKAQQNQASQAIAAAKKAGEDAAEAIAAMQEVAARGKALREELDGVQAELDAELAALPNPPDPTAADEDEVLYERGEPGAGRARTTSSWRGAWIDMEAGARVAGSRFAYLKGDLVLLELALVRWALEVLRGHGFEPVIPPVLVREEALYGTGFLPDTEQQIYRLADDALYLTGTSEVALASLHAGEILDGDRLPLRYAGFSPCFRREAGAAGRDTRGHLPRAPVRQGRDVQLRDARGRARRARAAARARGGDPAPRSASRTAWSTSRSASWAPRRRRSTTARRGCRGSSASASSPRRRTRPTSRRGGSTSATGRREGGPRHVATLNGTAVAVGRTLIALLENGQRDDGSVEIPAVLHPWGAPAELRVAG